MNQPKSLESVPGGIFGLGFDVQLFVSVKIRRIPCFLAVSTTLSRRWSPLGPSLIVCSPLERICDSRSIDSETYMK